MDAQLAAYQEICRTLNVFEMGLAVLSGVRVDRFAPPGFDMGRVGLACLGDVLRDGPRRVLV